ncbi:MAG: CPBP family intramembrane metalloprotease, partial [Coriobacteriales bacterium]|nr:CPBP family intramembrane metalloprotease [Coriobacteriales bacterium]
MSETRTGNGTGKLIAALLSLGLIYLGEIGGYLFSIVTGGDFDICVTMGGAIVAVLVFIALGGIRYLSFDVKAIIEAWKFMWWMILLSALLMVWDLYDYIAAGEVVHAGWFVRCVSSLVLCLAIGVHEEGMFRGVLFGGLLARLGEKKNGIWWAVGLSSLAFGCAHVTPYDFDVNNWLTFVQAFLKIIQTGIYAVMLCAVVLKTQNLIGAMVVHALDDWLLFVVSTGLFGESFETEYVVQDADEAAYTIIFYLI